MGLCKKHTPLCFDMRKLCNAPEYLISFPSVRCVLFLCQPSGIWGIVLVEVVMLVIIVVLS